MSEEKVKRPARRPSRKKVCAFCAVLAVAIKRARQMALIPYVGD